MARGKPEISARKEPVQARSRRLVADVLEAAIRVLEEEGAKAFTMARVAERAGVSVGSLYQYFPGKEAILFRLQTQEWEENRAFLTAILDNDRAPPEVRLKEMVRRFFRSEVEEAGMRGALAAAVPLYGDAPQARAHKEKAGRIFDGFMREALPQATSASRAFAADMVKTTLTAVGKQLSEEGRTLDQVDLMAAACADMLWGWLTGGRGEVPTASDGSAD